jgi:hypothetical protein
MEGSQRQLLWAICGAGYSLIHESGIWQTTEIALTRAFVELTGFEPVTPSLRTRCSARLSYSPRWVANSTGRRDADHLGRFT